MTIPNEIHPSVIIEGDVSLGTGNKILPYTVLTGPLKIGSNNLIGPHVVIGAPGMDTREPRHDSSKNPIEIGSDNIIREFTAIHKPRYREITRIHNGTFIMASTHLSHDAIVEDKVVMAMMSGVAGIVHLLEGANLAMGAKVHQYCIVGAYAIAGMGATVVKHIRPFSRHVPGKTRTVNTYAIKKHGFDEFTDEICRYVLDGISPQSDKIAGLVDRYEHLKKESSKGEY